MQGVWATFSSVLRMPKTKVFCSIPHFHFHFFDKEWKWSSLQVAAIWTSFSDKNRSLPRQSQRLIQETTLMLHSESLRNFQSPTWTGSTIVLSHKFDDQRLFKARIMYLTIERPFACFQFYSELHWAAEQRDGVRSCYQMMKKDSSYSYP